MAYKLLNPEIQKCLEERGFEPTPIQQRAIPEILSGKNVLLIAPTGTGKTESALLPLFHKFLDERPKQGITILYITPLRALNRDLLERVEFWKQRVGISTSVRHGDTPQKERTRQMKHPPQLLITTPETLGVILVAPKMGKHLENVKYVVIDEVHELVTDKRGAQLALALERLALVADDYQRIGLSATIGNPEKVMDFFKFDKLVHDPGIGRQLQIRVECPRFTQEDIKTAETLHTSPEVVARIRRIKQLVDENRAVLAFVNTRQMAELLASRFEALDKSKHIGVHHSSLSKDVRVVAEKKFKDGSIKGLISTSSLELGIDVGRIELVTQYMSPRQVSRLIQRVGRSGHTVDSFPKGVIITTDSEDVLEAAVITKNALLGNLEPIKTFEKPFDVLAQQLVGMSLSMGRMRIEYAYEIVKRAYPFRNLTFEEFNAVINQLVSQRILWQERGMFGRKKPAYLYYFSNLSMIPDGSRFFVKDILSNRNVAVLDESFVVNNLNIGELFISRGTPWKVLDIAEKEVLVEPAEDISGAIPAWEGEQIPVPYEIAQGVGALRREILEDTFNFTEYQMDKNAFIEALVLMKKQKPFFIPDDKHIVIETLDEFVIMYAHFGSLVNETLGKMLSVLLSSYYGTSIGVKSDPYKIVFQFPRDADPEMVKKFLLETQPKSLRTILERSLLRTALFRYRFMHVARRFGLIEKRYDYQRISIRRLIEAVLDSPIYKETLAEIFKEKLDLERTESILHNIQKGKTNINIYTGKPTPLSKFSIQRLMSFPDLVVPGRPEAEIIETMKNRIYERYAKLYCTYCGETFYSQIKNLPKKIKCSKCASTMITYTKSNDDLKKLFSKKKLTREEKKAKREYEQTTSLVNAYGKNAVIVLSGKGVGPDAATRILGKTRLAEKDLFKHMLNAQKDFLRTKRYWK